MSSKANTVSNSSVHVRDLRVVMGGNSIIDGLQLDILPGEFIVLLGPSGCGKSTLLNAVAGLIEVSGGQVEIGGRDVTWVDPKDRGIGMVFQSYALYPTMNVERNLSFGLRIARLPRAEREWASSTRFSAVTIPRARPSALDRRSPWPRPPLTERSRY